MSVYAALAISMWGLWKLNCDSVRLYKQMEAIKMIVHMRLLWIVVMGLSLWWDFWEWILWLVLSLFFLIFGNYLALTQVRMSYLALFLSLLNIKVVRSVMIQLSALMKSQVSKDFFFSSHSPVKCSSFFVLRLTSYLLTTFFLHHQFLHSCHPTWRFKLYSAAP